MAGCKPEYLPVVLAAVEAVLDEQFAMHGVLATTMFVGPVVIVNGPIRRRIGMNAKGNALGQGNRANASIGRALQLVIRNIGERTAAGGRPRDARQSRQATATASPRTRRARPGSRCRSNAASSRGVSAVTVFAGFGLQGVVDQKSRDPESLARSFAESLKAIHNVKLAPACDALLVVCPEHHRTFRERRLDRRRGSTRNSTGSARSPATIWSPAPRASPRAARPRWPARRSTSSGPGGLMIVRAGGEAGMFSGIIGGWSAGGPRGSMPVTREVRN